MIGGIKGWATNQLKWLGLWIGFATGITCLSSPSLECNLLRRPSLLRGRGSDILRRLILVRDLHAQRHPRLQSHEMVTNEVGIFGAGVSTTRAFGVKANRTAGTLAGDDTWDKPKDSVTGCACQKATGGEIRVICRSKSLQYS